MKILNKEFYSYSSVNGTGNRGKYDLPCYATLGSAAMDLVCTEDVTIYPGETKMISTGLAIWIGSNPFNVKAEKQHYNGDYSGYEHLDIAGLILPRSGLGTEGLILANTIGLIDEDYQGELKVSAWNRLKLSTKKGKMTPDGVHVNANSFILKAGDRFAQLAFMPVIKAQWEIVEEFSSKTERGEGSFGSTGDNNATRKEIE